MFRHILIPTDFSGISQRALKMGLDLALHHGAKVTLLHISEDFTAQSLADEDSMAIVGDIIEFDTKRLELAALDKLDELRKRPGADSESPRLQTRVVSGNPAQRILEIADEILADAIVMGTHGRHGFVDRILGSTAERVLKAANCSVLVVKPEGFPLTRN